MEHGDGEDEEPIPEVLADAEVGEEAVEEDFEFAGEVGGPEEAEGGGAAGEEVHEGAENEEAEGGGDLETALAGGEEYARES